MIVSFFFDSYMVHYLFLDLHRIGTGELSGNSLALHHQRICSTSRATTPPTLPTVTKHTDRLGGVHPRR
jgi:hypothetical protein